MHSKIPRYTLYALLLIFLSVIGSTAIANSNTYVLFVEVANVLEKVVKNDFSSTNTTATNTTALNGVFSRSEDSAATPAIFTTIIQGADEEVGCSVQGFTVARFNLCGDFDDRIIGLSGGPYSAVSWEVLGGSCTPDINEDCPNTGTCYTPLTSGQTFSLDASTVPATTGAEYRVIADGQIYYFKVKKSTITQTVVKQDNICGVPGRIK